jgi:mRNA interferase HigB
MVTILVILRMHLIKHKTLRQFWERHPDAEQPLREWYKTIKQGEWRSWQDVKAVFAALSVLKGNRLVFNIKGNKYRLVIQADYRYKIFYVRFIGLHRDYDRIDANTI